MNTSDDILLEKYFRGHLNEQEQLEFNERNDDPKFVEQFKIEKQLFESLNEHNWSFADHVNPETVSEYQKLFESDDIKKLRSTLKELSQNKENAHVRKLNWRPFMYAAAAVGMLLIALISYNTESTDVNDIYATYYDVNELTYSAVRSVDSNDNLYNARELFFERNYDKALALMNESSTQDGIDSPELLLMKGISLTELGKYEEAELMYDTLIASEFIDAQKGYWYKGLLFLKKGDASQALDIFKKIELENLYNSKKASEIIELLE